MGQPGSALSPPQEPFFQRLERASARLLMLDYDGTLAPFQVQRGEAQPYPGVQQALSAILRDGHTRLVIVSGRGLRNLVGLLSMDPLPDLWASHGWERRTAGGCVSPLPLPETAREGLALALRKAEEAGRGPQIEAKPAGVALHWRGLSSGEATALEAWGRTSWGTLVQSHSLEFHDFDGGLELRVPGRDKGTAVQTILSESPPDAVAAYLGDDLTDEDAFRALPPDGLGVLVRGELRPTAAGAWIRPPKELLDFLHRWKRKAERRG
jgi:trehalose-phosphatase